MASHRASVALAPVLGRALRGVTTVAIGVAFGLHLAPAATPVAARQAADPHPIAGHPTLADSHLAALEASLEQVALRLAALEKARSERTTAVEPEPATSHEPRREEPEPPTQRFAREASDPGWAASAQDEIYDWWYASPDVSPALVAVSCRTSLCAIEIDEAEGGEAMLEQILWDPPWNAALHTESDPVRNITRVFLERPAKH